jgi:phospholipid/cholesterol/gamma-HCH transport system substrate-binding protein
MYASRTTQFIVGIFAVLGIAALGYLSLRLGRIELFPAPGYVLHADFDNISGLKVGDQVQVAGVPVGKVVETSLQPAGERARVEMRLNKGVEIDSDAIAGVKTSGLIGDKYVAIQLGGGDPLKDGATIRHTQSSFVLEDMIGQLINNAGSSGNSSGGSGEKNNGGSANPSPSNSPSPSNPSGTGASAARPDRKEKK